MNEACCDVEGRGFFCHKICIYVCIGKLIGSSCLLPYLNAIFFLAIKQRTHSCGALLRVLTPYEDETMGQITHKARNRVLCIHKVCHIYA